MSGLFNNLGPLSGFANFNPGDDDLVRVVADKVDAVDSALGGNKLTGIYTCAHLRSDTDKVKDLTSIELSLIHGGSQSGKIDFTSLGLPSLGFLPKDAQKIDVNLSWSVNVRLITDGSGLRLAPAAGDVLELTLAATLTLPTSSFEVDLGALVVKATTITQPRFSGSLLVNVDDQGGSASFGPDAGFEAAWHLETRQPDHGRVRRSHHQLAAHSARREPRRTDDQGRAHEDRDGWVPERDPGRGRGDPRGHSPIRTVTSPMMEPIRIVRHLVGAHGRRRDDAAPHGGESNFPPEVREALEKLRLVDDVVSPSPATATRPTSAPSPS